MSIFRPEFEAALRIFAELSETLFALYEDADADYMERRIREETASQYGIADLKA